MRARDVVWIHDYHLIPLGEELRALGWEGPCGYFHHVPVPERTIWECIPHAHALAAALRAYDHVGVQTDRDGCRLRSLLLSGGTPVIEAQPAQIDAAQVRAIAGCTAVPLDERAIGGRAVLAGVDRLDYTKGIPLRLAAWERLLRERPALVDRAVFVQWAAPSREGVPEYRRERNAVEALAQGLTWRYGTTRPALMLDIREHPRAEVASMLRRADIGVVTPIADGMNLVAKEFSAVHDAEHPGVLVLSSGCGAAAALDQAVIVDTTSIQAIVAGIARAIDLSDSERRRRAQALREAIDAESTREWADRVTARITAARTMGATADRALRRRTRS